MRSCEGRFQALQPEARGQLPMNSAREPLPTRKNPYLGPWGCDFGSPAFAGGENAAPSRGATVHDPANPMGRMFFNIVAAFAEFEADLFERDVIRERTMAGLVAARARDG